MDKSFHELETMLNDKYGALFKELAPDGEYLGLDIIESYEDMVKLVPLFKGMLEGRFTEKEARNALYAIEARAWHTAEHLQRLGKALEDDD